MVTICSKFHRNPSTK